MSATILVCTNERRDPAQASCAARGSREILVALRQAAHGKVVKIEEIRCFGQCQHGPVVRIAPAGCFFYHVTPADAPLILAAWAAACLDR
jgi:(2Fe-2S) ferredoxin